MTRRRQEKILSPPDLFFVYSGSISDRFPLCFSLRYFRFHLHNQRGEIIFAILPAGCVSRPTRKSRKMGE
ncbi:MAG: hypothetical protein LBJ12_03200 [Oscillospiraceae bacterium]|jgi:hypothetical protein|nr:hypothetical protein [Oscillospiraceae bacterium]